MERINFDKKKFRLVSSSNVRDIGSATVFCFNQEGEVVYGKYKGGGVSRGTFVGRSMGNGSLETLFNHINKKGKLISGKSIATANQLSDGRLQVRESWEYHSDLSGSSVLEEVKQEPVASKAMQHLAMLARVLNFEHYVKLK